MSETIYIDRDNIIKRQLLKNGVAQSLASITKIVAKIGSIYISSETPAEWPIKWSGLTETGEVQLQLGPELPTTLNGRAKLWIIVYDTSNIDGIVWDSIDVMIINI